MSDDASKSEAHSKRLVLESDDGHVRILTLNRPAKRNALSEELLTAFVDALERAGASDDVHVIVVTGAGGLFSAGVDVNVFMTVAQGGEIPPVLTSIHESLRRVRKPLIAAVNGQAVGMGVTLLPHFDMVYASDSASFVVPFARLGLVVEYASSFTLPRLIGRQRANELVLRGKPLSAEDAADWGLVTRVFPANEFMGAVLEIANDVAALPNSALCDSKRLLREGEEGGSVADAVVRENDALTKRYGSAENIQAVQAFLSKRLKSA